MKHRLFDTSVCLRVKFSTRLHYLWVVVGIDGLLQHNLLVSKLALVYVDSHGRKYSSF